MTVTFSDPGTQDTFTANVDFGDGTTQSTTIGAGGSTHSFTMAHFYSDDNPTGTSSDLASISLSVVDDDTGSVSATNASITINNVAPTITGLGVAPNNINEGGATTLTVSFSDPGFLDTHTATVNWGDGSAAETMAVGVGESGNFFSLTHQYLDDNPTGTPSDINTIVVTLADDDTGSTSGSTPITVNNVAPGVPAIFTSASAIAEPATLSITVTFSDAGVQDTHTATVNWGDGTAVSTVSTAAGVTNFTAVHTYAADAAGTPAHTDTITVVVRDDDRGQSSGSASVTVVPPPPNPAYVVSDGSGGPPRVRVFAADGTLLFDFLAYDAGFTGGVRTALADVNGDGVADIITGAGVGGGPHVEVFDGRTGNLIRSFFAFESNFAGGVHVAAGDLDGDGMADIVVGAGSTGGPRVTVYSGADGHLMRDFFAYDTGFSGGVRVAVGDVNGDGTPDIITGAGLSGGPHVKVFDGRTNAVIRSFFAYDSNFSGGVFVAAADVNGDGKADIITTPDVNGGPDLRVFDGATQVMLMDKLVFDPGFLGGVRVAAIDPTGTGHANIIVTEGPSGSGLTRILDGRTAAELSEFNAFDPGFVGSVYVGGDVGHIRVE